MGDRRVVCHYRNFVADWNIDIMNKLLRRQLGMKKVDRLLKIWRARDTYMYRNNGEILEKERQHILKARTPCSCPLCGNPRRHFGEVTRQEKISALDTTENVW